MDDAARFRALFETTYGPVRWYLHHRDLLDKAGAAGPFDDLGIETVSGVETHHLRATNPALMPLLELVYDFRAGATVTAVDLWVADDLVRRLDLHVDDDPGDPGAPHVTGSYSIVYSHIGEPIEVPADTTPAG